jgi:hypothetical protein
MEFLLMPYHSGPSKKGKEEAVTVAAAAPAEGAIILGDVEDVTTLLEESQMTLQTMMASRFVGVVQKEVDQWDKRLSALSELLEEWLLMQVTQRTYYGRLF